MFRAIPVFCLLFSLILVGDLTAQSKKKAAKNKPGKSNAAGDNELKLEDIYPEKSMFGPSARGAAFSADGRYAAYLYRPYLERRHGNDLWLYDFKTDKLIRLTSVHGMSKFQKSARAVKQDRIEKAKKKLKQETAADGKSSKADEKQGKTSKENAKQKKAASKKQQEQDELKMVETVDESDADDEKAPRYSGISSFEWHPETNSMLVMSEGDIYQIANVAKPEMSRLTRTDNSESQVDFLPDGSGYTYNDDSVVHRVRFGSHMIEQINPRIPGNLRLSSYALSPDGKRIALVGRSNTSFFASGNRTINYIRYGDRFAKAATAPRTVSDDEVPEVDVRVYLYDFTRSGTEESELIEIFQAKIDEPRDVISSPKWSPDSSSVTFCFFNQEDAEVHIRLSEFPTQEQIKKSLKTEKPAEDKQAEESSTERSRGRGSRSRSNPASSVAEIPARTVYRFKHDGGPNTPRMVSPDFAADSRHIVFVSEQSGFRHVHKLDPLYETVTQLTSGHYEVYPIRFSKDHSQLFVTATKDSSARTMVYTLDIESGELKRLSKSDGTYSSVDVSNDGKRLIANYVTYGKLTELVRQNEKRQAKTLTDSHPEKTHKLTATKPEFFEYENRHGHTIKGMMFKPDGWKKNQKRPLLIYVYGGPLGTRKSVTDGSYHSAGYFFQSYMAKKHGYLTVVIDPRGQSGYGGLFEKSNYEQVGKPQVEDLVDGVKFLTKEYNIDNKRVAMHGWSFGGFQTQMCMYTEPDVFQVGIAGAGPTEWENYNAWYTTGTVGPSRKGEPDQKKYSLRPLAKNLKGKLLLIHGMADTNVLFQDTIAIYRELLKAGKESHVELFLDPTGGHGLGGDVKNLGRYRKYESFLLQHIGKGK